MTRPDIEELRAAPEDEVWMLFQIALTRFVRSRLARRYSPQYLVQATQWDDDAVHDLIGDFLADRPGIIPSAVRAVSSTEAAVSYMEKALYRYACDRAVCQADNVYKRLRKVMESDPLLEACNGSGIRTLYGLKEWGGTVELTLQDSVEVTAKFIPKDIKRIEYSRGKRISPTLGSDELQRIARALITATGVLLTVGDVMRCIEVRFELRNQLADVDLDSLASISINPLHTIIADELAKKVLSVVSPLQREILRLQCNASSPLSARNIELELKGATYARGKSAIHKATTEIAFIFEALRIVAPDERSQVLTSIGMKLPPPSADKKAR